MKGTTFRPETNSFRAVIMVNGVRKHLGYFISKEKAHLVYLKEKSKHKRQYNKKATLN